MMTTLRSHIVGFTLVAALLSVCHIAAAAVSGDQCKAQETQAVAINAYGRRLSIDDESTPFYQPTDSLASPRFSGVRTYARLPHVTSMEGVDVAVFGIPFDTGASFKIGQRYGPESVRSASHLLRPYNPDVNVTVFGALSCVDFGDVSVVPGYIQASYAAMEKDITELAEAGVVTLGFGGDHSVTLGELRALAKVHGPMSLVHFDSHSDVWDSYFGKKYNHGTPFRRAVEEGLLLPSKSIQIGMRGPLYSATDRKDATDLGFNVLTTSDLASLKPLVLGAAVRRIVGASPAFLSFDVDFFDPAYAPGTGTPEVGGPSTQVGLGYLRALRDINWVGGDVVEVLPALDHGQITAHAAAQVGFEFLSLVAARAEALRTVRAECDALRKDKEEL
ncbi:agmatinase [Klebsormidium nitens]|uniref:Agmatinase n=1 Tax=Klebsormidium nitens TaxID=105231 RepID=A0A1Y1HT36_KLENI|nr:agmatinase [Klebsormidium nitens]|eukprot:GAQ79707.1 agmatinase [Klebsormidium nitens]